VKFRARELTWISLWKIQVSPKKKMHPGPGTGVQNENQQGIFRKSAHSPSNLIMRNYPD